MMHRKPITRTDVLGKLERSPESAVDEYNVSVMQNIYEIKPPSWDNTSDELDLFYLRNVWDHNVMRRTFKNMLENEKYMDKKNRMRLRTYYRMTNGLRRRFVLVNGFLKDCSDKRNAAEKKLAIQSTEQSSLKKSIEESQFSLDELGEFRNRLIETVKLYEPYERIIKEVVSKSNIYQSEKDCVDRCDALMLAQTEIEADMLHKIIEIETTQKAMIQLTKNAALTILGMNNMLAQLDRDYKAASNECQRWESMITRIKQTIIKCHLDRERIRDAIRHMFVLLCNRRGIKPYFERDEVEGQLDFIKDDLEMMQRVLHAYYKEVREEAEKAAEDKAKARKLSRKASIKFAEGVQFKTK